MPASCGEAFGSVLTLANHLSSHEWKWHFTFALAAVGLGSAYHLRRYWRSQLRLGPKQAIVITGCDSGLGYSLALHCRDYQASLIATVLREDSPGALELKRMGLRVLPLDITDQASVTYFVKVLRKIIQDKGLELHTLVNNAGVLVFGEFEWQVAQQVRMQLEVNVLGTMSITQALIPLLRRDSGRIVNVTSHCALASLPGLAVYGATKAALQAWSNSLRLELGKYGVDVVMLIPGNFLKESNIMARQEKYFEEMRNNMDEDTWLFYGEYFEKYKRHLASVPKVNGLRQVDNPKLYKAFDGAILDRYPSALYKCEPWRYTFYHGLFQIAPTYTRDWLVQRFVQMPSW